MTGEDIFRDLPEIDIREIRIERSPVRVWQALVDDFGAQPAAAARYAQLVGADPQRPIGCFPEVGASVPGFAVAVARADERLVLVGRHRFSRYALVFDLEPSVKGPASPRRRTHPFRASSAASTDVPSSAPGAIA